MPHSEEVADALSDAVAADAYVGPCPKCGKDLQLKASHKTKSMFIGCAGWPDCDVTYPLPKGKIEAVPEKCPTCGMPQVKVTAFRSKPRVQCIDPACPSTRSPRSWWASAPCARAQARQEPHRPAQPAHAEALYHLRELRRVSDALPAAPVRRHHSHRGGVRALRRAHGGHQDGTRAVEAVPELRLPGQGGGREGEG
ncbi:MAG: topoisomerase DNA-binding C4 zinc finger domain-containing protein [Adlercreutzia sp.]